jgi:ABC-2 type transport system ATP-binding protein
MIPAIEIRDLYKKYQASDAYSINGLNLTIAQQEIFGILGPNGAGKTTLISILCHLIHPSSGSFTILGETYKNNRFAIKKRMGVVPQDIALYPTLTARENLQYFGSMYGLKGKKLTHKITEGLSLLGLSKFSDKKINTFSGGMKRRVNLIAGTLHQPDILFLDEPTVGVDVQSKNAIIDFLRKLNQEKTTLVYTSHHLIEAQDFCTQIAIMDQGKVYAQGSPQELINQVPGAKNLEDVFIALTGKELRDAI